MHNFWMKPGKLLTQAIEKYDGLAQCLAGVSCFDNPNYSPRFGMHLLMKGVGGRGGTLYFHLHCIAEFLMPVTDMNEFFKISKIDLGYLGSLKPIWRDSIAALLRRAYDLGYITPTYFKRLNIQINQLGYKKKEPFAIDNEREGLLKEIIQTYKEGMEYSDDELAKIML